MLRSSALSLVLLAGAVATASATDLYRWTDNAGKTHYGNEVPEQYKSKAKRVDGGAEPTDEQRQEAAARAAKEKAQADAAGAKAGTVPAATAATPVPEGPKPEPSCEELRRQWEESKDCFGKYAIATGGVRAEAFQMCREVKQPNC